MVRFRDVLFKKNFFFLWSGQIISEFGDRLNQMALIALVYSKSPGSVMAMANLLFFIVIPVFLIGPVAGAYVDRWDRKKIMIISDSMRGLLVLVIPIFVVMDMMVPVYILVFLIFSGTRFFLPSKMALIPSIVPRENLLVANSLSNTTRMIAAMLGFAIAGFLVKWVGYMWGFYLNGISYFISAVLIAMITPKEGLKDLREDLYITKEIIGGSIRRNIFREMVEGFAHVFSDERMRAVTVTLFLVMGGAGAVFCVMIVFVQESFGGVTEDLGLLGTFVGVGLFIGTILYGKLCQNFQKIRAMLTSFSLCGIFLSLFAFYAKTSGLVAAGALLLVLIGVSAAPIFTCANYLIHVSVPDNARGRIFSSMELVMHAAFLIFMFLSAALSKRVTAFSILFYSGVVFCFLGGIGQLAVKTGGRRA
jgi:MFS transporter, DHA3 family, macrolide efflux protein